MAKVDVNDQMIAQGTDYKNDTKRYIAVKRYNDFPFVRLSMSFRALGQAKIAANLTPTQAVELAECLIEAAESARACGGE